MPFTRFENDSVEESHTIDPENLPIFLIPGINGNGNELRALAEAINQKRDGRTPIYIYEEPIFEGEPLKFTLAEHAALIADEIQEIRQFSPLPYILVGYSFGGVLAADVALKLQKLNYDPRLYVIDEPTKSLSKQYCKEDSDNFKRDLGKIVNYAATLSGIKPIEINKDILSSLELLTLEERIDQLASVVLGLQDSIQNSQEVSFYTFLQTAKRNLRNISLSDSDSGQKLAKTHLILTNETALKYSNGKQSAQTFTGGWDEFSREVIQLNPYITSKLSKQLHMDLLKGKPKKQKEDSNAELVAGLIIRSLENEIKQKHLMQRHLQDILSRNKKRSPIQFFNLFNNSKDLTIASDTAQLNAAKSGSGDDALDFDPDLRYSTESPLTVSPRLSSCVA